MSVQAAATTGETAQVDLARLCEGAGLAVIRYRVWPTRGFDSANQACERLTGYSARQLAGDPSLVERLLSPEERARIATRPRDGDSGAPIVVRLRHPDGRLLFAEVRRFAVHDESGRHVAFECIAADVTAREEAQQRLRESEERFRQLAERAPDAISRLRLRPAAHYEYVSPAVQALTGYPPEAFLADPDFPARIIVPEDLPLLGALESRVRGGPARMTLRVRRADGRVTHVEHQMSPELDAAGEIVAIETIARDVSEREDAERLLRTGIDALPVQLAILDEAGTVLTVNHAWRHWTEEHPSPLGVREGTNLAAVCEEDSALPALRQLACGLRALLAGERQRFELSLDCAVGGQRRWYRLRLSRLEDTLPARIVLLHEDVSELRSAEEQLRLLSSAVEHTDDSLLVTDSQDVVQYVNPAFERLTGYSQEELVGRPLPLVRAEGAPRDSYLALWRQSEPTGTLRAVFRDQRKGGEELFLEKAITPLHDEEGRLTHFVITARDVTARRHAEQRLAESERRYRRLQEVANDVLTITGPDGRILYESPNAERILGRSLHPGEPLRLDCVHPDDRGWTMDLVDQVRARPLARASAVYRLRLTPEGPYRVFETVLVNASDDPLLGGVVLTTRDVSERARTEEALRQSEQSFRSLIEQLPTGVGVAHAGQLTYANPELERILGAPAGGLTGRHLQALGFSAEEGAAPRQTTFARADGTSVMVETSALRVVFGGKPSVAWLVRDLTEQRQLQARLFLADRMASVGTLAAGVAHEINNPLAYVVVNVGWVRQELARAQAQGGALQPEVLQESVGALDEARDGCERVRQIVRDLKTFSRADDETREQVDVRRVLESCIGMAHNEIRHRARLVKAFEEVPLVAANEARLGQVFLNLLVNAAQAIPEGDTHSQEIRLATRRGPAGEVVVEVQDSGCGIPAPNQERIFDPFFTTKAVGVGTGLGLSICHSIVASLGGSIEVESAPGEGSLFRVLLPPAHASAPPPARPRPGEAERPRRARVLVVDDEAQVGAALQRLLREWHDVTCETDARQALERLRRGERFDVLFCDLMMPHMSGMELHQRLQRELPAQAGRMVFITGGAFTPAAAAFLDTVPNRRLEKPFDTAEVRAVVQALRSEDAA